MSSKRRTFSTYANWALVISSPGLLFTMRGRIHRSGFITTLPSVWYWMLPSVCAIAQPEVTTSPRSLVTNVNMDRKVRTRRRVDRETQDIRSVLSLLDTKWHTKQIQQVVPALWCDAQSYLSVLKCQLDWRQRGRNVHWPETVVQNPGWRGVRGWIQRLFVWTSPHPLRVTSKCTRNDILHTHKGCWSDQSD